MVGASEAEKLYKEYHEKYPYDMEEVERWLRDLYETNTLIGDIRGRTCSCRYFMIRSDRQDMLEGVPAYSWLKPCIC